MLLFTVPFGTSSSSISTSPKGISSSVISCSGIPSSVDGADPRSAAIPGPAGTAGSLIITPGTGELVDVGTTEPPDVLLVGIGVGAVVASGDGETVGSGVVDGAGITVGSGVVVGASVGSGVAVGVGSTAF